ncbi:hypothetical protein ACFQAT_16145 [Undibacterium arcticum]|uniref:hypothetical protein n=1 Tax=Undibacterium arcticum TaxID=1762892 RepID=UPI00360E5234
MVLEYTHIYLNQPGHMTDAFRARLKAHLRSDQLVHWSLAIATFNAFSKCAVVIGGMPDSMPVTELSASSLRPL